MSAELVSVIIPVRNAIRTVEGCLLSALKATVSGSRVQVIVVEDGSTDGTAELVDSLSATVNGGRLKVLRTAQKGISTALNVGIASTRARYIARLDADDEMHPERLDKQVQFMEAHDRCGALGTRAVIGDAWDATPRRVHDHPTEVLSLRFALLLSNPFVHASMLIRRDALAEVGGYNEALPHIQDYDLWSRMSRRWDVANLSGYYTLYRETRDSVSRPRSGAASITEACVRVSESNIRCLLKTDELSREHRDLVACFYGQANRTVIPPASRARALLSQLAEKVAGPRDKWSSEYAQVYDQINRKLIRSCVLARVSPALLRLIRMGKQYTDRYLGSRSGRIMCGCLEHTKRIT